MHPVFIALQQLCFLQIFLFFFFLVAERSLDLLSVSSKLFEV